MKIGFLGAGQMAKALAGGFIKAGLVAPADACASDVSQRALVEWTAETRGAACYSNLEVVARSQVVFLTIKPQTMEAVLSEIAAATTPAHLIVSIAAGVTLGQLMDAFGADRRLVRVMPNTPALVGAGAAGMAIGGAATVADAELMLTFFRSIGTAFLVEEKLLDAVTGLSGSGPAFVFQFIEALADGGVAAGLSRQAATTLAAQTVLGSARMVLETGKHPAELKDQVASPAGTTIAGIAVLEKAAFRGAVMAAVQAAADRSYQLGRK